MKKRTLVASVLITAFFIGLTARIGYIIFSGAYAVSESYNSYSIVLDTLEPNLYYSDYTRLTNNKKAQYALLKPNAKTLAELPKLYDETEDIYQELREGKPILRAYTGSYQPEYIKVLDVTYSENTCRQLLAMDCGGLLKYLPSSIGTRRLRFPVDAMGRMLTGSDGEIIDDNYVSSAGLLLTLEPRVQAVVYDACQNMRSGCVVVMNVATSEILACVNKPDSTYTNKALSLSSVGSVFKLVIAACALENGLNPEYTCNGKIKISDTEYRCQKERSHGLQHLEGALCNSCNCYFVHLALQLGADKILETAKSFGLAEDILLYNHWLVKGASLPSREALLSRGELPLIGFGQGSLLISPLQFCHILCAIANSGRYNQVRLVNAEVGSNGTRTYLPVSDSKKAVSPKTAYLLLRYMRSVVENGTGKAADYKGKSAGKTATAQTGQYENNRELLNTWFAGVYPYDKPEYAIVIMNEKGTSGAEDCCPVFRTIVEKLDRL